MKPSGWRLLAVFLPLYAGTILLGIAALRDAPKYLLQPVHQIGPPLRAGDRVYVLTGQLQWRFWSRRARHPMIDLWAFDARKAAPVWRKRLHGEQDGSLTGQSILGAEGDTLWVLMSKGLTAASLGTGDFLADTASLEARNSSLRGLIPREAHFYRFDSEGLRFHAADGQDWRLDPQTFLARPAETARTSATAVISPANFLVNSTEAFQERGLVIPGRWLGLLNNAEAAELAERGTVDRLDGQSRGRLWEARTKVEKRIVGDRIAYSHLTPLGGSYLTPGLLSLNGQPILLREPDSILILYRDRLGEKGHLQLDRVAGPAGRIVWKRALPLSVLQSVMPGAHSLVLSGLLFAPRQDKSSRDPLHDAHEMVISVDLTTGEVHSHDQSDTQHHPAPIPAAAVPGTAAK